VKAKEAVLSVFSCILFRVFIQQQRPSSTTGVVIQGVDDEEVIESSDNVIIGARLGLPLRQRNAFNTNVANNQRNANARRRGLLLGYAAGMA